jgi:ATP-dependent Clp protease ATP-binding subunit ClpA
VPSLFADGIFAPTAAGDDRLLDILMDAVRRAAGQVRTSDILYAAIDSGDRTVLSVVSDALADGARPVHVLETIREYNPGNGGTVPTVTGERGQFTPEVLAALDAFAAEPDGAPAPGRGPAVALERLLALVLDHLEAVDRRFLSILDAPVAAAALRARARASTERFPPLLDERSGRLRSEEFSEDAWAVLELAAERAAALGYDRLFPPHLLLAHLAGSEGLAERLLRLQLPPQVGLAKVTQAVEGAFRLSDHARQAPPLDRAGLAESTVELLAAAQRAARGAGGETADVPQLLDALLADPPSRLATVLRADPLRVDLARMREHLAQALREERVSGPREVPFRFPPQTPPAEDLTWLARTSDPAPAPHLDRYFDPLCRALHRSTGNHVLITADPGAGATTLLRELARRAAGGEIPFLGRKRLVRVDGSEVEPSADGRPLHRLLDHVAGRTDLILCLDGLAGLLRGPGGTSHVRALRGALKERRVQLIGVLTSQEYDDLLAGDQALRELTTRITLTEPGRDAAVDMVRQAAAALAAEFGVAVRDGAVRRAVAMSGDYIFSQRLPLVAVKVLRRACEDLDYRRGQLGDGQDAVDADDVVRVIAEFSGVPAGQIAGTGQARTDFEQALSGVVFGQRQAITAVAHELRRIKAGLAALDGGPASVLLFAGLTGVGKTELAKTVAQFYSASKSLQVFPMENFTERHSVSGIIGSPPGYLGHEAGGRLINDLNSDPYCVFLLDEAEKAHPEVWRPFLHLFDEGWIIDQRGVKAHGDRAIFILTTNAGHEVIERLSRAGRPAEEIEDAVRDALYRLRSSDSGSAVFTPEFVARIKRIIVFEPLDAAAMLGIARKLTDRQRTFWREKREKELLVPEELVRHIGAEAHRRNERSGGRKGGRVVRQLLADLLDRPLLLAQDRQEEAFRLATRIELLFTAPGPDASAPDVPGPDAGPRVEVRFHRPPVELGKHPS